jgi:hypothetical protein
VDKPARRHAAVAAARPKRARTLLIAGTVAAVVSLGGVASAMGWHGGSGRPSAPTTGVRLAPMTAGRSLEPVRVYVAVEHGPRGSVHAGHGQRLLASPTTGQTYVVRSQPAAVLKASAATARPALTQWEVQLRAPASSSFDHPLRPVMLIADVDGAGLVLLPVNRSSDLSNFSVLVPTEPYALLVARELTTSTRLAAPTSPGRFLVSAIPPVAVTRG